jgi:hypothetical protein
MLLAGAAPGGARRVSRVAALVLAALLPGCVTRTLTLRSDPPGATVILDGRVAGTTPCEAPIPAWGTRSLELDLAGYQSLVTDLPLDTPWWDHWPLDMFAAPWPIHVQRDFAFTLQRTVALDLGWDAADEALAHARAAQAPEPKP